MINGIYFRLEKSESNTEGPPSFTFSRFLDSSGKVNLTFSQPLLLPYSIKDLNYSSLFEFKIESVVDSSLTFGPWNSTQDNSSKAFSWEVTLHSNTQVCFSFHFVDPSMISNLAFGKDILRAKILDSGYFLSRDGLLRLEGTRAIDRLPIMPQLTKAA